jgi:hypothetical protein
MRQRVFVRAREGDGDGWSCEVKVNCLVYVHVQLETVAAAAASIGSGCAPLLAPNFGGTQQRREWGTMIHLWNRFVVIKIQGSKKQHKGKGVNMKEGVIVCIC